MADMQRAVQPPAGAEVRSRDDKNIGRLGDMIGDYFQVIDNNGREYWFSCSLIRESDDQRVQVSFGSGDMSTQAVPSPEAREESAYLDDVSTPEEERQRELMLRELAEQRRDMHQDDETTSEAEDTVGEPVERELSRMTGEQVPQPDEATERERSGPSREEQDVSPSELPDHEEPRRMTG